ncbi:hypothetical protein LAZ67_2004289 [Cordylochernes scorpioides]|uniref:Uncharacterized protein n=1 Tax=Cordylochernes scorpioides TaxID=51811 RepID=A0ABY6K3P6_9ARAC|nr:hypothetical protein LAZ67_2004289 [Cordylochernes scorpioides]
MLGLTHLNIYGQTQHGTSWFNSVIRTRVKVLNSGPYYPKVGDNLARNPTAHHPESLSVHDTPGDSLHPGITLRRRPPSRGYDKCGYHLQVPSCLEVGNTSHHIDLPTLWERTLAVHRLTLGFRVIAIDPCLVACDYLVFPFRIRSCHFQHVLTGCKPTQFLLISEESWDEFCRSLFEPQIFGYDPSNRRLGVSLKRQLEDGKDVLEYPSSGNLRTERTSWSIPKRQLEDGKDALDIARAATRGSQACDGAATREHVRKHVPMFSHVTQRSVTLPPRVSQLLF